MLKQDLRKIRLFQELEDDELDELVERFEEQEVAAEELVVDGRHGASGFYVIRSGGVVVFHDAVGEPVQLIARLRRGDFFGELDLFGSVERSASVRASEPSILLKIPRHQLLGFLERRPWIKVKLQVAALERHSASLAAALELGRRREVRISLYEPVVLELEDGRRHAAVVENLSIGGLSLAPVPEGWVEGRQVRFRLRLRTGALELSGRVAWRHAASVGVSFTETAPNHGSLIQLSIRALLATRRQAGPEPTLSARFTEGDEER